MSMKFSMMRPFRKELRVISWFACAFAPASFMGAGCVVEPPCSTADIPEVGSAVQNEVFAGTTAGQEDLFQSSCGFSGAPDTAFSWRAPASGNYRFDTTGSELDTVLSLWTGDVCDGQEVACNDDDDLSFSSQVDVQLEAGETIYVVVEGFVGEAGSFVVNVRELVEQQCGDGLDDDDDDLVDCADPDCGCECPNGMLAETLAEPFAGSTEGGNDFGAGSCGGSRAPDTSLTWTPPRTARYRIDTAGSSFDTVLYVQEGDVCGGAELACNDDTDGFQSQVELGLTAGQSVVITVDGLDGESGDYVLDITEVTELDCTDGFDEDEDGTVDCADDDCDCTCPSEDLGSVLGSSVQTGTTVGRGDLGAGSCGGDGAADASFVWTALETGDYRIGTAGSSFDTVLYVQDGAVCGGAELACNDDTDVGLESQVELGLTAGQSVVITVDGLDGFFDEAGSYALNIECLTCP